MTLLSKAHGSDASLDASAKRMTLRSWKSKRVQPGFPVFANYTHAPWMKSESASGGLLPSD